jgi:hypothetical protein
VLVEEEGKFDENIQEERQCSSRWRWWNRERSRRCQW